MGCKARQSFKRAPRPRPRRTFLLLLRKGSFPLKLQFKGLCWYSERDKKVFQNIDFSNLEYLDMKANA